MARLRYVITSRVDDSLDAGVPVPFARLYPTVRELSGREVGDWLSRNLHTRGRCYVATANGSPGRAHYGRGFIVHSILS